MHLQRAKDAGKRLVVVQGECHLGGVDLEFKLWGEEARLAGHPVRVEGHPAQGHPTQDFGKWPSAGPNRNRYMVSLGAMRCVGVLYACNSIYCKRPAPHPSHGADSCLRMALAAHIPITRLDLWKT
jgi:hypothetical protein